MGEVSTWQGYILLSLVSAHIPVLFFPIFLAALGLPCCAQAFSVAVPELLVVVALLLQNTGSRACGVSSFCAAGLSCLAACGIVLGQGWN